VTNSSEEAATNPRVRQPFRVRPKKPEACKRFRGSARSARDSSLNSNRWWSVVELRQGCVTRRLIPATLVAMTTTTPMTAVHQSEPAGLPSRARRFMTWRCTRPRGQRIPRDLWPAATASARIHGTSPTVAALKLNYYDRQRRLHSGQACRRGRPPDAVFVEVPWPCSRPAHPHPRGQSNSGRTCRCASVATYSFGVSSQAKIRDIPVA
jgi:hypothetical protein